MDETPRWPCTALLAGTVLGWRRAEGHCVLCLEGVLWITEEGLATDHWLAPGDHCVMTGPGLVVIEALRDAVLLRSPTRRGDRW